MNVLTQPLFLIHSHSLSFTSSLSLSLSLFASFSLPIDLWIHLFFLHSHIIKLKSIMQTIKAAPRDWYIYIILSFYLVFSLSSFLIKLIEVKFTLSIWCHVFNLPPLICNFCLFSFVLLTYMWYILRGFHNGASFVWFPVVMHALLQDEKELIS